MGAEGSKPFNETVPSSGTTVSTSTVAYPTTTTGNSTTALNLNPMISRTACANECLGEVRKKYSGVIDTMRHGEELIPRDSCSMECVSQYGRFRDPITDDFSPQLYIAAQQPVPVSQPVPTYQQTKVNNAGSGISYYLFLFLIFVITILALAFFGKGILQRQKSTAE